MVGLPHQTLLITPALTSWRPPAPQKIGEFVRILRVVTMITGLPSTHWRGWLSDLVRCGKIRSGFFREFRRDPRKNPVVIESR
jgi:hypothetical protein